jgi:hypothetical protein
MLCGVFFFLRLCDDEVPPQEAPVRTIPDWLLYPSEVPGVLRNALTGDADPPGPGCEHFIHHRPLGPRTAVGHAGIPSHPFMASNAGNNMHCDAYMSDTYRATGPYGPDPEVHSRSQGFGGYGTIAFDRAGRIVAVFSNARAFQLELMDPDTLEELASYDLPPRPWYFPLQGVLPWEYIGAGMYFYLDHRDRAVVPTTDNTIQVVQVPDPSGRGHFELVRKYDLSEHVVPERWPKQDSVAWVLPSWDGEHYWYATTGGMLGTVDVASGHVRTKRLEGEVIENSFAVGEDGVFILSDRALYRFSKDGTGNVVTDWRTEYDRGTSKKPGHITRGSGTSVTLMGGPEGLAVIADNAEPRINLVSVRRSDGGVACSIPVFEHGKSGTDISTAGFEHADATGRGTGVYSVLVENNWGHHSFPRSRPEPGLTRVDITRNRDGDYNCQEIWTSQERSIGVFKLSLGNGLVYMYWRSESCPITNWYLTAVDFWTGETVYKKLTGTGLGYNNWAGALFLHPDGGIAYSTTLFGLVTVRTRGSDPDETP